MKEQATEHEWLKWFFVNADFGPGHSEAMDLYREEFEKSTGKALPDGYGWYCESCGEKMTSEEHEELGQFCNDCR